MVISNVYVLPPAPCVDDKITIGVEVKNQGQVDAQNFDLSFKLDHEDMYRVYWHGVPLGPDQTFSYKKVYNAGDISAGVHRFDYTVDFEDNVVESDDSNNHAMGNFQVSSCVTPTSPEPTPTSPQPTPTSPQPTPSSGPTVIPTAPYPSISPTPSSGATVIPTAPYPSVSPTVPQNAVDCGPIDVYGEDGSTNTDERVTFYDFVNFATKYHRTCKDDDKVDNGDYDPCGGKNRRFTPDDHEVNFYDFVHFGAVYNDSHCLGNAYASVQALPQTGDIDLSTQTNAVKLTPSYSALETGEELQIKITNGYEYPADGIQLRLEISGGKLISYTAPSNDNAMTLGSCENTSKTWLDNKVCADIVYKNGLSKDADLGIMTVKRTDDSQNIAINLASSTQFVSLSGKDIESVNCSGVVGMYGDLDALNTDNIRTNCVLTTSPTPASSAPTQAESSASTARSNKAVIWMALVLGIGSGGVMLGVLIYKYIKNKKLP